MRDVEHCNLMSPTVGEVQILRMSQQLEMFTLEGDKQPNEGCTNKVEILQIILRSGKNCEKILGDRPVEKTCEEKCR